jgi:hypothetical protein
MAAYGIAIGNALNALRKGQASVDEVMALRDQVQAIVSAQGDLSAALKDIDAEIQRQGAGPKAPPPPPSERFVAQIDGLDLSDAVKLKIEAALHEAVMAEIAKLDTGGDLVASPLSRAKGLTSVLGGRPWPPVMGLMIQPR